MLCRVGHIAVENMSSSVRQSSSLSLATTTCTIILLIFISIPRRCVLFGAPSSKNTAYHGFILLTKRLAQNRWQAQQEKAKRTRKRYAANWYPCSTRQVLLS